jgi:predicted SnoaL-like aldol condensation-catalyzing enzyme
MCYVHQQLVHRLFDEVMNQGNLALIDLLYVPNVVDRNVLVGQASGRADIYRSLAELHTLLRNLHVVIELMSGEAGMVVTHERWSGVHSSAGKQVTGTVSHIFHIHDGRIVEEWSGGWEWLIV